MSRLKINVSKLDKVFSKYIRTRDNWTCTRCGTYYEPPTSALHCSHFHGRRKKSVRWDEMNADAHCFGCHQYLGSNPLDFTEWKREQLGGKKFGHLNRRANLVKKWTKKEQEELYYYYKKKIDRLNKERQ